MLKEKIFDYIVEEIPNVPPKYMDIWITKKKNEGWSVILEKTIDNRELVIFRRLVATIPIFLHQKKIKGVTEEVLNEWSIAGFEVVS